MTFRRIEYDTEYPIRFLFIKKNEKTEGSVTKEGIHNNSYDGECTFFPSREQRDWSKFTAPWLKKERFDPKTLMPFDKVLVRDYDTDNWFCNFFSHIIKHEGYKYVTIIHHCYMYCIPYNDDTKHLVGTSNEAPEYYRYWED